MGGWAGLRAWSVIQPHRHHVSCCLALQVAGRHATASLLQRPRFGCWLLWFKLGAGVPLEIYVRSLYLMLLVAPPGGESWQALQQALSWPTLQSILATQIGMHAAAVMWPGNWREKYPNLAHECLAWDLRDASPGACLASLSLMAAGVAQLTDQQQGQQAQGQQAQGQQGQQAAGAGAEPGSAVSVAAGFTAKEMPWVLLGQAAAVGSARRRAQLEHVLAPPLQQQQLQGRRRQQTAALAEAALLTGLQLHLRNIRAGLREVGAAADAAAATGRQAELADADVACWVSILWEAMEVLHLETAKILGGVSTHQPPQQQQQQHEHGQEGAPRGGAASSGEGQSSVAEEAAGARRVLGRAWQQLPLQETAPLAEAIVRLLCRVQHVKPLLRLGAGAEPDALAFLHLSSDGGNSSTCSSSPEALAAGSLATWLLECMQIWQLETRAGTASPPTAAGGAATCALLQSCCKLVQHAAQLRSQGALQALLFAPTWNEAGALLGQMLGSGVSIGAQWLLTDQSKLLHTSAAMAAAPRRWVARF